MLRITIEKENYFKNQKRYLRPYSELMNMYIPFDFQHLLPESDNLLLALWIQKLGQAKQ